MIKYHILALLCLVAAGISLVELMVVSAQPQCYKLASFWLMAIVFIFSLVIYFRVKGLRKVAMQESERGYKANRTAKKVSKK